MGETAFVHFKFPPKKIFILWGCSLPIGSVCKRFIWAVWDNDNSVNNHLSLNLYYSYQQSTTSFVCMTVIQQGNRMSYCDWLLFHSTLPKCWSRHMLSGCIGLQLCCSFGVMFLQLLLPFLWRLLPGFPSG